jgi:hypothetical protein
MQPPSSPRAGARVRLLPEQLQALASGERETAAPRLFQERRRPAFAARRGSSKHGRVLAEDPSRRGQQIIPPNLGVTAFAHEQSCGAVGRDDRIRRGPITRRGPAARSLRTGRDRPALAIGTTAFVVPLAPAARSQRRHSDGQDPAVFPSRRTCGSDQTRNSATLAALAARQSTRKRQAV